MESVYDFLKRSRREDEAKVALVVQGGGMRGVYSMGALAGLEAAGLRDSFDLAVGSSAGAINCCYLLAGQADAAVKVYVDLLSNKNFVNPVRLWKVVDIDYLVDDALKRQCPLDVAAVRASPTDLHIVLTDAKTAETAVVTNRDASLDLYEVIRATAALPALYNRKIRLGEHTYVDGGVANSVPVDRALDLGATAVLGVTTRELGHRRHAKSALFRRISKLAAVGQSTAVKETIGREDTAFNDAMDLLEGVARRDGVTAWCVRPTNSDRLADRTTTDKELLSSCALMGKEDMLRFLESPVELFRAK